MSDGKTFFEKAVELNDAPVKNGLCSICKGAHRLCGKDRCPLMIKFYSQQRTMPLIDMKDLAGSSPPSVFVGRYGYPKVDIGPLIPPEFGDTTVMDRPEMWMGKSIDEIVDFRFRLVRGKYRIDATDFRTSASRAGSWTTYRSLRSPRSRSTSRRRSRRSRAAGLSSTMRSSPSAPLRGWKG